MILVEFHIGLELMGYSKRTMQLNGYSSESLTFVVHILGCYIAI